VRILTLLLLAAAIGSLTVSLLSHQQRVDGGWSIYTPDGGNPLTSGGIDPNQVFEYPDDTAVRIDAYDDLPWNDARLWLGLAIGFALSAVATSLTVLRRRAPA
jgi:hypothetical protein